MKRAPGSLIDQDWLTTATGYTLHHATALPDDLIEAIEGGEVVELVRLDCGRRATVMLPGVFTRMGADRCYRCCDRNGLPQGTGSPKNDNACRALLGLEVTS